MREIKFRGKRVDNGGWVEGYYFESFTGIPYIMVLHDHILKMTEYYQVIYATIGQYTELKDKNGKEIYEGDVVVYTSENTVQSRVSFESGCFWVTFNSYKYELFRYISSGKLEVIGNIHTEVGK
jgi:uncharacterized phage protein (TIGR01671 family)